MLTSSNSINADVTIARSAFDAVIRRISGENSSDKDFAMLVDECELNIGIGGRREDNFYTRVLRIHNMIDSLHMNGCLSFNSYLPE